jgi:hypothetical protein
MEVYTQTCELTIIEKLSIISIYRFREVLSAFLPSDAVLDQLAKMPKASTTDDGGDCGTGDGFVTDPAIAISFLEEKGRISYLMLIVLMGIRDAGRVVRMIDSQPSVVLSDLETSAAIE